MSALTQKQFYEFNLEQIEIRLDEIKKLTKHYGDIVSHRDNSLMQELLFAQYQNERDILLEQKNAIKNKLGEVELEEL